jgi:hypothetical protein
MQLVISADDNLGDVLAQLGQMFGRELQVAGTSDVSVVASSQTRPAGGSGARTAGKGPALKDRSATSRGTKRAEPAAKRGASARSKKMSATATTAAAPTWDTTPVRAWARANGHSVNARGRLPAAVLKAYLAAHN